MVIFWERWDTMVFSCENHWDQWFFDGFAPLWPSPLTTFLITDHWTRWFFNGFGVIQPSPFNDFQPPDHCFQWFSKFFRFWTPMVNDGFACPLRVEMSLNFSKTTWTVDCLGWNMVRWPALLCSANDPTTKFLTATTRESFIKLPDILKLIITNHFFYIP